MTDFIKKQISKGSSVNRFKIDGYWLDIGQTKDYEQAQTDIADGRI